MSGRGGIENDQVVLSGFHDVGYPDNSHQLIQAREGKVEELINILVIEVSAPVGQLPDYLTMFLFELLKQPGGIKLHSPDVVHPGDGSNIIPDRTVKTIS